MSLLTQQTSANGKSFYFLLANVSTLNVNSISTGQIVSGSVSSFNLAACNAVVSSLGAGTISTAVLEVDDGIFSTFSTVLGDVNELQTSTIFTTQLTLDSQTLNATPSELLLNGIPIATTSNLSSLSDWALDPAISTVNMAGNNLINANTIVGSNAMFGNLMANNIFALSTYTSTVSSLIEVADFGYFNFLTASTFTAASVSTISLAASTISSGNVYVDFISCGKLNVDMLSSQSIFVSSLNGAELTTNGITISSIITESISTLSAEIRQGLFSSIVFSPNFEFPINFNFDFKPLAAAIGAGLTEIAVGVGGGLVAVASGLVALAVSRSQGNITNNFYEQYAIPTQFQFSTLGEATSSFTRFVSSSGQANTVPGVEFIISTIIPAGTLALRSLGDPVNLADPSTVTSSIQAFGQWVALPDEIVTSSFSTFAVANLTANRITTSSIVGGEASLLTIGAPLIHLSTAAVGGLVFTDGEMDALRFESREVWTSSIITSSIQTSSIQAWDMQIQDITAAQVSTANVNAYNITSYDISTAVVLGANPGAYSLELRARPGGTFYLNGQGATIAGATVTSSLNADGVVGNYGLLGIVSTATILGANSNLFGIGVQGLELRTDPTGQVWVSSPQTNIAGFINCSTIGANRMTSRVAEFSTLNVTGLSTVTLSTLGTAGSALQPAGRLLVTGNDVDLGQQDLWCQQIRLGAGNPGGSAQTEVIWYSPDNLTTRGIGLGGSDLTLRLQSTINSGTNNGYLLDTTINRPFFSTLNGVSTALMASYPSTNLGNFGVSTLALLPAPLPLQLFGVSSFQAAAFNISLPQNYKDTSYGIQITPMDNTIQPPHASTVSVSSFLVHAGGGASIGIGFFWQTIGLNY